MFFGASPSGPEVLDLVRRRAGMHTCHSTRTVLQETRSDPEPRCRPETCATDVPLVTCVLRRICSRVRDGSILKAPAARRPRSRRLAISHHS